MVCNILGFDHWIRVEAVGYGGGIWVLWQDTLQVKILRTRPQFVHMVVTPQGGQPWLLSIIYGSPNPSLWKYLWTLIDVNLISIYCMIFMCLYNINARFVSISYKKALILHLLMFCRIRRKIKQSDGRNQGKMKFLIYGRLLTAAKRKLHCYEAKE